MILNHYNLYLGLALISPEYTKLVALTLSCKWSDFEQTMSQKHIKVVDQSLLCVYLLSMKIWIFHYIQGQWINVQSNNQALSEIMLSTTQMVTLLGPLSYL